MNTNKYFQKYHSKLRLEAILKSALCGLSVGFGANFIAALVTWFASFDGLWISLSIFIGVTLIAAPIFYFKRFRPNDIKNARRIDRLGLDERLITMVEYDNDDSFIARAQREDAKLALETVEKKQIKFKISRGIVTAVICFAILGTGMTTVNTLSEYGLMPGGDDIVNSIIEDQLTVYVTVSYEIGDGGVIEGDEAQVIVLGTDATTVTAVADDGYMFKEWSDGSTDPTRTDVGVTEDVVYEAVFVEVEDGDGEGDGDEEGEGDEPQDAPSDEGEGEGGGGNGPESPSNPGGTSGGGLNEPNDKIVDNELNYHEVLEYYQGKADEDIQSDGSGLSDAEKEIIKKYLGIV